MKTVNAVIELKVPEYQISEPVMVYFKDTMMKHGVCENQQDKQKRIIQWLAKFCNHIDNDGKHLTDAENLQFFKEKMFQQFGWCIE